MSGEGPWSDEEPDPDEVGEPIAELRGYAVAVRRSVVEGVRRRIERRGLTSDLMDMVWRGGAALAVEWLNAAFEPLKRGRDDGAAASPDRARDEEG
jgi:hypothetical protein